MSNDKYLAHHTTLRTKRKLVLKWLNVNDALEAKVLDFLRVNFHPNEPLNRSIDLMSFPQDVTTLDVLYKNCFPHGASVVALDENGNLVGVLLNDILKRNADEHTDAEGEDPNWNPTPRYAKFLDLIPQIAKDMRLFEKYPKVDAILDHAILSVGDGWQGDGISQILVDYANSVIAKKFNCGLSFVICSSYFSARVFEKCGYKEIWSKKFRDYQENGNILFPTESPHDNITCKLLELN